MSILFCVIFSTFRGEFMLTYETIKKFCKVKGVTVTGVEKELGFARGSLCKINTNKPSVDKVQKLADYFDVSVDYLTTGEDNSKKNPQLKPRDEKDIKEILASTEQLLKQDGLMFDGQPASAEAIDSILSAMQIGMEMAKKKNKEKYTPKKYKKD